MDQSFRSFDFSGSSVTVTEDHLSDDPEELQRMKLALAEMEKKLFEIQEKRELLAQLNAELDDVHREFAKKSNEVHVRLDEFEKMIPKSELERQKELFLEMKLQPTPSVSCENLVAKNMTKNNDDNACPLCKEKTTVCKEVTPKPVKTAVDSSSGGMGTTQELALETPKPVSASTDGTVSLVDRLDEISSASESSKYFSQASSLWFDKLEPKDGVKARHDIYCICCAGHY